MNAPITYIPNFISDPTKVLSILQNELDWERRDNTPRCEYYCNDFDKPYVYGVGKGQRKYLPKPYHAEILNIRNKIEEISKSSFEVCFLNRYLNQKDQLGWHADDSPEMDDSRPIAIVSFGVEREIWFREECGPESYKEPNPISKKYYTPVKLKLENGSLCLMHAKMQEAWQHRIPKASFLCGERISLTYRGYVHL